MTIETGAFVASGITEVTLNDGLKTIGAKAFSQTYITSLTFPDSVTEVGGLCPGELSRPGGGYHWRWHHQPAGTLCLHSQPCPYFRRFWKYQLPVVDNVLFSMDGTVLMCHPAAQTELVSTGVYTIPANVTKVAEYAFAYLSNLKELRFSPEAKLEEIGAYAFAFTPIPSW